MNYVVLFWELRDLFWCSYAIPFYFIHESLFVFQVCCSFVLCTSKTILLFGPIKIDFMGIRGHYNIRNGKECADLVYGSNLCLSCF